jgi:hypothetical protein
MLASQSHISILAEFRMPGMQNYGTRPAVSGVERNWDDILQP